MFNKLFDLDHNKIYLSLEIEQKVSQWSLGVYLLEMNSLVVSQMSPISPCTLHLFESLDDIHEE